ncbi:MAG: rRNA maturation RNase YbeY [Flavobacterium sp.]|nr:rRNA maturation RNase YbeY [Flavobacterium sp.]
MISFNYETDFILSDEIQISSWLSDVILSEDKQEGEINFVFCDDNYLLNINEKYLKHDTLTDIISFDYSIGNELHGDVFISVERVTENAIEFNVTFKDELLRVLSHGILHYCGFKDKSVPDIEIMRMKEDEKILMFHVKHHD